MSSFICSAETFNKVEDTLLHLIRKDRFHLNYKLKTILPQFFDNRYYSQEDRDSVISEIIAEVKILQILCVTLQYKHHLENKTVEEECAEQYKILRERKNGSIHPSTPTALYKSMGSILYKIETHHVKDLRPLTEKEEGAMLFMETVKTDVAEYIIEESDEYNEAQWG